LPSGYAAAAARRRVVSQTKEVLAADPRLGLVVLGRALTDPPSGIPDCTWGKRFRKLARA
jgi:hypothetical protein